MRIKILLNILVLSVLAILFSSCNDNDKEGKKVTNYKEHVLTVASKKVPGVLLSGHNIVSEVYAVKKNLTDEWSAYGSIEGFEYEKGYEYKIKVSETSYLDYSMGQPAWTEVDLLEVISKDKKDSEGIPLHFIPETYYENIPLPKYKYVVEADNKEIVEEDLKSNSILPIDYHYILYRDNDGGLKWIGLRNDIDTFGPYMIIPKNKKPEEMPESYKLLPPEGSVRGHGEWTFLDEVGNTTVYPSFDVFIGNGTKIEKKSTPPTPNTFFLYKDLSRNYQIKYPNAGVKTVVVSYSITFKYL